MRRDLAEFDPNLVHVAAPDIVAHRAVTWARKRGVPVVSSVTQGSTPTSNITGCIGSEPVVRAITRRYYRRCDAIVAPAESTAAILRGSV